MATEIGVFDPDAAERIDAARRTLRCCTYCGKPINPSFYQTTELDVPIERHYACAVTQRIREEQAHGRA